MALKQTGIPAILWTHAPNSLFCFRGWGKADGANTHHVALTSTDKLNSMLLCSDTDYSEVSRHPCSDSLMQPLCATSPPCANSSLPAVVKTTHAPNVSIWPPSAAHFLLSLWTCEQHRPGHLQHLQLLPTRKVRLAERLRRKDTTLHAWCSQLHHHKQPKPLHSVQNTVWERRPHLSNTSFWSCGAKPKPVYCDYCETVLPQRYFKSDCMESSYLLQMHIAVSATPPKRVLPTCSNTLHYQWTSGLLH